MSDIQKIRNRGGVQRARIAYIDAMKGFASLWVVLAHVTGKFFNTHTYPSIEVFESNIIAIAGVFHMVLFMTISGYLFQGVYIGEDEKLNRPRWKKQLLNSLMVYIFFSVIVGVMRVLMASQNISPDSITDVFFIWIKPIGVYWYLYVLMVLYLVFASEKLRLVNTGKMVVILSVLSMLDTLAGLPLDRILYYAVFFYLGMLYRKYPRWLDDHKKLVYVWASAAIAICAGYCIAVGIKSSAAEEISISMPVLKQFIALGISAGIWFSFQHIPCLGSNKLLTLLGRNALEIYVLHDMFAVASKMLLLKIGITNGYLSITAGFLLSAAGPVLVAVICKKLHIHGYFFKPFSTFEKLAKKAAA